MQKIFQTDWFDIDFREFATLSDTDLADEEFYRRFYEVFFSRYSSFEDIPLGWRQLKQEVANDILNVAQGATSVLSIGCGIGYVERCLNESATGFRKFVAIEPNANVSSWVSDLPIEVRHGLFPDVVQEPFDFAYACNIDYVFDDTQYARFLKSVFDYECGSFMLASISTGVHSWCYRDHLRAVLYPALVKFRLRKKGQLWGYLRSIEEHLCFLREAGFSSFQCGKHGTLNNYWIHARRGQE